MKKREYFFDVLKENYQAMYTDDLIKYQCALNLIRFGRFQFMDTYLYENVATLDKETRSKPSKEQELILMPFVHNGLIDSVKISICFENVFKAILLLKDCLIHNLKGEDIKRLSKKIKHTPVLVESLLELKEWEVNSEIKISNELYKQQIDSISNNTLNYGNLILKSNYRKIIAEALKIENDSIFNILNEYRENRNKLHLHTSTSSSINQNTYNEYLQLKKVVDENILSLENKLFEHLGITNKNPVCIINYS
jgi:hypothetical protein